MIFIACFFFWTKGNNRGLRPPCVLFMQNHWQFYESPANSIFTALYHCYWYKLINQYHIGELLCKTIFPHLGYDDMNIANPELMMKRALLFHCFRLYYITFTFLCYLDSLFHCVSKMLKSISHFIHKPNGGYLFILLFSVYELDGVPSETTRLFRQLAEGLAIPQKKKYRKNIPYKTNSSNIVGKCKDILRFKIN